MPCTHLPLLPSSCRLSALPQHALAGKGRWTGALTCPAITTTVRESGNTSELRIERLSEHPVLRREWHPALNGSREPADFKAGSNKKAWWRCQGCQFCGRQHDWEAMICNRAIFGTGCPYCKARNGRVCLCNSVASHPVLGPEYDVTANYPLGPQDVSLGSCRKVKWQCLANPDHGSYVQQVKQRSDKRNTGCPLCAAEVPRPGIWHGMLEAEFPDLAREWLQPVMEEGDSKKKSLSPANVRSGSSLRASWKCSRCGHVWVAAVKDRALRNTGCSSCNKGGAPPKAP